MPLSMKDRNQLHNWLASRATLADVESVSRFGLVENERFTEKARKAFFFLWAWSTPRYTGIPGFMQDRYYATHGPAALDRRMARVRRLAHRLGMPHA